MERHKCKLCSRSFSNGRALGGHMKAHLATLPLPPPKPHSFSFSSSSSESEQQQEELLHNRETEEKSAIYALRENSKKSFRLTDPEFGVQDRESETESKNTMIMMMTRQRSKRNRKSSTIFPSTPNLMQNSSESEELKKPKLSFGAEPEPVVSSVSDASTEEDVAMCLMMLSRDTWKKNHNNAAKQDKQNQQDEELEDEEKGEEVEIKVKQRVKGKNQNQCEGCGKTFRSSRALGSHRSICCRGESGTAGGERVFECPFCFKVFGSGQALGGHKRSHLMGIAATTSSTVNNGSVMWKKNSRESFIDLNLPAPVEDDDGHDDGELSVVSDVSNA